MLGKEESCTQLRCCAVCKQTVSHWLPHVEDGERSEFASAVHCIDRDLPNHFCPACDSTDQDRHLWLFMTESGFLQQLQSFLMLHVNPEPAIERLIRAAMPMSYVSGGPHPANIDHINFDLDALPFDDGSFDLIICNHALEQVTDPLATVRELYRCIRPGGILIAQTSYSPMLKHTLELTERVSPALARVLYGGSDNLRMFGADLLDLFSEAGFKGMPLPHHIVLKTFDHAEFGVNPNEPFFAFSK